MFKDYAAEFCLVLFICLSAMLTGCDSSGYMMQEPYVITGTVATGLPVSGTVEVFTFKRFDRYIASIDPETGWYSVTVEKPDPPYLLRARLDEDKTYFSYTSGERNPRIGDISDLTDAEAEILIENTGLSSDTISSLSDEEYDQLLEGELARLSEEEIIELLKTDRYLTQTVNITPLTDLVIGLAYGKEPWAIFAINVFSSFPPTTPLRQMKTRVDKQFSATYKYLKPRLDTTIPYMEFNMFHSDMTDNFKILVSLIQVNWVDLPDQQEVIVTVGDGLLDPEYMDSSDYVFFDWDFIEHEMAFDEDAMTDSDVLTRLQTVPGFPDLE